MPSMWGFTVSELEFRLYAQMSCLRNYLETVTMNKHIDLVFDGPPSHESGRFVEGENSEGVSLNFGEWIERPDGYWILRIADITALQEELEKLKWDRDGFMSALERVSFERDKYRVTVEKIAKQIKSDEEIDGILVSEYGNIQAGYDGIIDVAREALSTIDKPTKQEPTREGSDG